MYRANLRRFESHEEVVLQNPEQSSQMYRYVNKALEAGHLATLGAKNTFYVIPGVRNCAKTSLTIRKPHVSPNYLALARCSNFLPLPSIILGS